MKEDYYIQQLNSQSTWIVVFVTSLFALFSVIEIGIFMDKIKASQQEQVKQNEDTIKKIHDLETGLNSLKESLQTTTETFKKEVQVNFENLAKEYSQKYKQLRTGLYIQTSNLSFFASENQYNNKQYAECVYITSEGLKFQVELLKDAEIVQSRPELARVAKNHLAKVLSCLILIIQDKELKSAFKNAPFFKFVSENFIAINGFNHPELRDQVIDILGLLKEFSKNDNEEKTEPLG